MDKIKNKQIQLLWKLMVRAMCIKMSSSRFGSITCDHMNFSASFAINSNCSRFFFVWCVNNNDDVRLFFEAFGMTTAFCHTGKKRSDSVLVGFHLLKRIITMLKCTLQRQREKRQMCA